MIFGFPLANIFGMLTGLSLFLTAGFGIAYHVYRKQVFGYHKFFAFLTLTLAVIHMVLATLLFFGKLVI